MSRSYGWDPMYLDVDFTTRTPTAALEAELGRRFRAMGWRMTPPFRGPGESWARTLPGGTTATATFGGNRSTGQWYLHASSPPATHPVTGC
jgi:hypothetical protein